MKLASACFSLSQATGIEGDLDSALGHAVESAKEFTALLGAEAESTLEVKKFIALLINALQKRQAQAESQALQIQQQKEAARLQAQVPASARGLRNGRLAPSSSTANAAEVAPEPVVPTPTRGSQSVEELVSFITGTKAKAPSTKSKKRRASPPSNA